MQCDNLYEWTETFHTKIHLKNLLFAGGPQKRSQYSDLLRAGRSGDRAPLGGEIFRTRPDQPLGPTSLQSNGYRVSSPGLKRPGRGVDHSLPCRDEFKKEWAIPLLTL